ncbi:MAG: HD domain-containing protein [Rhodospirillaceae bacterium]|nr:HD domain-containing protein [Rhodospirillaceae bacterium]
MTATTIEQVVAVLESMGAHQYGREPVIQQDHALQCAELALRGGAGASLIVASLLHDIGHLTEPEAETADVDGTDLRHEATGAKWLSGLFGDDVLMPIRLHVAAKRYLTAIEESYMAKLSPQSVRSLELQGGPFAPVEVERYIAAPFAKDAVLLRRWDDSAKVAGKLTPGPEHFVPYMQECALA